MKQIQEEKCLFFHVSSSLRKKNSRRIYLFRSIFLAFDLRSTVFCIWLFVWSLLCRTLCSLCVTTFEERTNVSLKVKKINKNKSHIYYENETVETLTVLCFWCFTLSFMAFTLFTAAQPLQYMELQRQKYKEKLPNQQVYYTKN